MIRKSRLIGAIGLTLALGVSSLAFAVGTDNEAVVLGKVSPSKLDKKKYKPVKLFTGLENTDPAFITGTQPNPIHEYISYGKDIKFNLKAADECTAPLTNGSTSDQAKAACPKGSFLGSGDGAVTRPDHSVISDVVISVFHGSGNSLRLHTYSPTLLAASPIVNATIEKSKDGGKYGQALSVPATPETGPLLITRFVANIDKSTKTVLARCKSKTIPFLRTISYKDGTSETASLTQKCKRKGGKKK